MAFAVAPASNLTQSYDTSLYRRSILTRKVSIPFRMIGKNTGLHLNKALVREYEGKCSVDGYIRRNSIEVMNCSAGAVDSDNVVFTVKFECLICNPKEGNMFNVVARNITKAGVRATTASTGAGAGAGARASASASADEESPVVVFLAREHHLECDEFASISADDVIRVRVIGTRFELNDAHISVIAEFVSMATRRP